MEEVKKRRKRNAFDRIVLSQESQNVLTKLIAEVSESSNGLLNLHGREIANFLIQSRSQSLTTKELAEIREKYFDDTKAANWMVNQIREARSQGESVDLETLIKKLRMQSVEKKQHSTKASKPRKPKGQDAPGLQTEVAQDGESKHQESDSAPQ